MSELPTRALSLTGPWWWFMLHLPPEWLKRIENRRLGFSHKSFRGPVWVHAAKCVSLTQYNGAVAFARNVVGVPDDVLAKCPSYDMLKRGGIVGRFTIVDMLPAPYLCALPDRWRMAGCVGFVVEDAQPVDFVPCRGALGFWRVPSATLATLEARAA